MPPTRDEQIVIIAPGCQVTLAQFGLGETPTPAALRIRSCVFPAEKPGEWEPFKVREKLYIPPKPQESQTQTQTEPDPKVPPSDPASSIPGVILTQPTEVTTTVTTTVATTTTIGTETAQGLTTLEVNQVKTDTATMIEEEPAIESVEPQIVYYEDFQSEEDAVWPMEEGRIVNWPAFFALLTFVHKRLSLHAHSQFLVMMVAQPCWTPKDHERLTQFYFETFKTPGFVIVDSAMMALWAHDVKDACVVDVGYQKTDVTAIANMSISVPGRRIAVPDVGGDAFTKHLQELLGPKNFTYDMCEQLKRSPICEIPPEGLPLPGSGEEDSAPAAAVAAASSDQQVPITPTSVGFPALGELASDERKNSLEADGVLDLASIVGGGQKRLDEFLAKKEKEKEMKAHKKGLRDAAALASAKAKLRNVEVERNTFTYEEVALVDDDQRASGRTHSVTPREVEVGIERLQVGTGGTIDRIADAINNTISSVVDLSKRAAIWDHLIVVGNGARIKGFREELLAAIRRKYIVSSTIFTSEIPSQLSTPIGTGTNTPQPQSQSQSQSQSQQFGQASSSVNPLLHQALLASQFATPNGGANVGNSSSSQLTSSAHSHSDHGQTPKSCKIVKVGDYFSEWHDVGYDEAQFLGAQLVAKILFGDSPPAKAFMTRNDYNDYGPRIIREFGL